MCNNYDLLIICYKSGQIPEDEWQEILKDEVFYCYYQKQIRL